MVCYPSKGYRVRVKFKDDDSIPVSIKTKVPFILFDYFKFIKQIKNKDNIKEYRPYILLNGNINLKKEPNKELGFVKFSITDDISTKDIEDLKLFIEDRLN